MIDRAPKGIREGVRAAIDMLDEMLSDECDFVYESRVLEMEYRGVCAAHMRVGQKQSWIYVTHQGWTPPMIVSSPEDCEDEDARRGILERFAKTRAAIDAKLDAA